MKKVYHKEIWYEGTDWIHRAQETDWSWFFVKRRGPINGEEFE